MDRLEVKESPEQLFDKAGYKLYKCESYQDVLKFKKYFKKNEELCTFYDTSRITYNTIFFAVKKNIDEIKRENFNNPQRQDEYGTSVISLQFTKTNPSFLSIKNRYNHTVTNPDATFSNDLENIYPGLTKSFKKFYNIIQSKKNQVEFYLSRYVRAGDGKYYKYNHELNTVCFCPNNIIISGDYKVKHYNKDRYLVVDNFIIDLKEKTITQPASVSYHDSFIDSLGKIQKINVTKLNNGERLIEISNANQEIVQMVIDKTNCIIKYTNNFLTELKDDFLKYNTVLKEINIPNVKSIGNNCLSSNRSLLEFDAPNLLTIGEGFLRDNTCLNKLNVLELTRLGAECFLCNRSLTEFNAPNLVSMSSNCLYENNIISSIYIPSLIEMQNSCFHCNKNLKMFNAPNLKVIGSYCFHSNKALKELYIPNLENMAHDCFSYNSSLENFNAPKLKVMEERCFFSNQNMTEFYAPELIKMDDSTLRHNIKLQKFYAPKLEYMEDYVLQNNKSLKILNLPSLKKMGMDCLNKNECLMYFNAPLLIEMNWGCLQNNKSLTKFNMPMLQQLGDECLEENEKIIEFNTPNLYKIGAYCLHKNNVLKNINAPRLKYGSKDLLALAGKKDLYGFYNLKGNYEK